MLVTMLVRSLCLTFHSPNQRINPGMGRQKTCFGRFFVGGIKQMLYQICINIFMHIFRNTPKDIWPILYTITVGLIPFAIISVNLDIIWWITILPFQAWLICNLQNSPLHHHAHWPTFINKKANALYELLLSMISGVTHQSWKWAHHAHHVHVNDHPVNGKTKDPVSVFANGKNGKVENFWKFCFRGAVNAMQTNAFHKNSISTQFNSTQNNMESLSWIIYCAIIFVVDIKFGLWMILVYFVAHFLNYVTSYAEHWGVLDRRGDTTQDSVGIYTKWYNWIGFNGGYHQEHHNKPGTHWTKLPALTPKMHPDRKIVKTMYIFNVPYWSHFKLLFKP